MSQILLLMKTGIVTWLWLPINCLLLFIDGVIYTLVALSYKLFQLMAQLNFNALSSWMTALVDRVNAVIAVLVLFILGYSLIQYLINPDKANDKSKSGGVAMIKNIAIASILLISYGFIFGVLNEFTFILVGTPANYKYTYLNDLFGVENNGGDEGLIMRFVVGGESTAENGTKIDYGRKLAITTLSSFLHGWEEDGLYNREEGWDKSIVGEVYDEALKEDDFNLIGKLITVVGEVGRSVYYFPIISSAIGAYIVYSIVMVSVELGVRAFKLMILQIIAPVAIISIMKDGFEAKIWKAYKTELINTYKDAFIRIAAMYFAFAFISVAYNNLDQLFAGAPETDGFTKILLYMLIIWSALKLGKELPKLIDKVFDTHMSDSKNLGLGQFLATAGGIAGGYGLGKLTGAVSGAATRWRNSRNAGMGFWRSFGNSALGGFSGSITGGISGAVAGSHLKGDKIKDYFTTGGKAISEGWRTGSPGIAGYWMGLREEYGGGGAKKEVTELEALEKRKQLVLNRAGKQTFTEADGNGVTLDLSKDRGSAVAAALKTDTRNGELQDMLAQAQKDPSLSYTDTSGRRWTTSEIRTEIKARETALEGYYDSMVGDALSGDTQGTGSYTSLAKGYARQHASSAGTTATALEQQLVRNSAATLRRRKAEAAIKENSISRTGASSSGGGK